MLVGASPQWGVEVVATGTSGGGQFDRYPAPSQVARLLAGSCDTIVRLVRAGELPLPETPLGRVLQRRDVEAYAQWQAAQAKVA